MSTLVQIDRLGHAWSGVGADERFSDSQGPDASRMVWAFRPGSSLVEIPETAPEPSAIYESAW